MLKNYIITAIRNLKRNKTYTFINVFGLALGISAALVLFKIVIFEKSFDKHHSNFEDIYRFNKEEIASNVTEVGPGIPHPFSEAFETDFPDYGILTKTFYAGDGQLSVKGASGQYQHFEMERGVAFTDNNFFTVFDFEFLVGDVKLALSGPKTTVITESLALRLFGKDKTELDQVIGREIMMDNELSVNVVAVIADLPQNTMFPFQIMIDYESLDGFYDFFFPNQWGASSSQGNVFLLKADGVTKEQIDAQMDAFEKKHMGDDATTNNFFLQPLKDVHFQPEVAVYGDRFIDPQEMMIPSLVAIFLVLTACVNFVNLATAQAVKRSKEVGIRKVLGGEKRQLILQFMGETFFLTLIAVIISLGVAELAMNNFQELIGYELSLNLLNDPQLPLILGLTTIGVTLLAGIYPSLILSSLKPVTALKSKGQAAMSGKVNLRRGLVIFQFAISQFLVICTLVVISQMNYFENKDLGFKRSSIVNFALPDRDFDKLNLIANELRRNARVSAVSYGFSTPSSDSNIGSTFNYAPLESENGFDASFKVIDENYLDLYEIQLLAGRNLKASDTTFTNVMVSEKVLQIMHIDNPEDAIGLKIQTGINGPKTIVGVFNDFHATSLREEIPPLLMLNYPGFYYQGGVKFEGDENQTKDIIANIEALWVEHYPDYIFDYAIYSETLLEFYSDEANMLDRYQVFSGIAILIGCLGLYGLISFMANQRTKEIGVRKVLGASVGQVLGIFSKELTLLILIAFLVAAPVAYYFMNSWLQDFEYSISIGVWVFAVAVAFTLVIGGATTGFRSLKAARANPVDSLRAE